MNFEQQWTNAANTLVALVTTYGLRVVGAIIILLIGWWISRLLYKGVQRLLVRTQRIDRTITLFLANAVRYLVLVLTFSAVLSTFGVATTSFVAVLGALGIAVGLALQGTLSNLAAGIMLVLFRPFHIDDRVEAGGIAGRVREINLFYSELDTDDNVRVIFPNGKLWGEVVKVPSRNDTERVELKFTRPFSDDIETAVSRVRELVNQDRRIKRVAQIGVDTVNEANYVLVVRVWVTREQAPQVHFDLNRMVKEEFQRSAPQREEARAAD
ncbi:MAG: mechanosensitive ion channel family protein [Proteobacteria bacterium]|nr:mechanosensitive ion channel family protein [Pseudomonadota bacterium]